MYKHRAFLAFISLILLEVPAHSFNVYRLGGTDGNPWNAGMSYEPGEYLIIGPDGTMTGRGVITSPSIYPTWLDTMVEVVDSLDGQWLRPFFVADTLNLAQDGVRERIKRGFTSNLLTSDECVNNAAQVDKIRPMFDGDPHTAAFFVASATEDRDIRRGFYVQNSIVDLGTDYPINRVRFFPRLGTSNPEIDEILEGMAVPRLRKEDLQEEDFSENFLPWFEVAGANSLLNFAAICNLSPYFFIINKNIETPQNDPRLTIFYRDTENQKAVVDIHFPVQELQWIAIRPLHPIRNWEIAEFQVFGTGYISRTIYTTAVLDFGEPMIWGKIRWKGNKDKDARVLIRTRSGMDADPLRYWIPSGIPGELKELTRSEYERASLTERSTSLDEENWSFWSSPYIWEAGLRDTALTAFPWRDGIPILSPAPARYLQIQVLFLSTLEETGKLQELEIQFSKPAARRVVGEIWPLDVSRTESTSFTYNVRPTLDDENLGFDRLEIFTLTRVDTVRSVRLDGVEVIDQFPPEIQKDRIVVGFPILQGSKDTFKLIEVTFDTRVVRYGTEFRGWVFKNQANGVKQLIEPGDANVEFPGNALGVRTENLGTDLITQLEVVPSPFTPNGDGINDVVHFQFQLHEVSVPRDLTLSIYDMSGRLVHQLNSKPVIRGLFGDRPGDPTWDGLDDSGARVSPGIYLYRISLDTDKGKEEKVGTISVAY